jgi:hypothetical protein
LGPPGADVTVVTSSTTEASLVLAGTAPEGSFGGSLYLSNDYGVSWSIVPALAGKSVFDIKVDPEGGIYLGTQDGLWMSSDNAQTWTPLNLNIGINNVVAAVEIGHDDARIIWVGIADAIGAQPINVMRSVDGGLTWEDMMPPHPAPMTCTGIAVDPEDANTAIAVFGGTLGGGEVWTTVDGGSTWINRTAGLPANPMRAVSYDGARLLVGGGLKFGSQDVGLYASFDMGVSWQALHDDSWPLRVVTDITVDSSNSQIIYVTTDGEGINRTTNGGGTWEVGVGGTAGFAAQSLRYDPKSSALFLATTSLGIFRSIDGGDSFLPSGTGMSELNVTSIAASPTNTRLIAVAFAGANSGGVYRSEDNGARWTIENLPPTRYAAVGFAPNGVLYAISSGPTDIAQEGLTAATTTGHGWRWGQTKGPFSNRTLQLCSSARRTRT